MPTLEQNKSIWAGSYNWENRGDEWSAGWGGPSMQWYGSILPRINAHVPANRILEIACGYGRWTHYLKDLCNKLYALDLGEECIRYCKQRFASCSNIEYILNDGMSLEMIPDGSIDFVFSFDSLVHADESVLDSYMSQLPRILSNEGTVFIHHSNLFAYNRKYSIIRKVPKLEGALKLVGILDRSLHWRDFSVDAKKVERMADKYGLHCVSQEIVNWGTKRAYIDCMSTIKAAIAASAHAPNTVLHNKYFMREARNLRALSGLYGQRADGSSEAHFQPDA